VGEQKKRLSSDKSRIMLLRLEHCWQCALATPC
jgi:hypothetical protein